MEADLEGSPTLMCGTVQLSLSRCHVVPLYALFKGMLYNPLWNSESVRLLILGGGGGGGRGGAGGGGGVMKSATKKGTWW